MRGGFRADLAGRRHRSRGDADALDMLYDPSFEQPRIVNEALLGRTPEAVARLKKRGRALALLEQGMEAAARRP